MNIKQNTALIRDFFNGHSLINTTISGNQFEFNCKSDVVYPVAHIEYLTQGTGGTYKRLTYLITIADIFDPNAGEYLEGTTNFIGSEDDIYSDTNEIADDFFNYFSNMYEDNYKILDASNVEIKKFTNGNVDRVCGCTFLATFEQFRIASNCDIPLKQIKD